MEAIDGIELLLDVGLDRRVTDSTEIDVGTGDGRWSRRQVMVSFAGCDARGVAAGSSRTRG